MSARLGVHAERQAADEVRGVGRRRRRHRHRPQRPPLRRGRAGQHLLRRPARPDQEAQAEAATLSAAAITAAATATPRPASAGDGSAGEGSAGESSAGDAREQGPAADGVEDVCLDGAREEHGLLPHRRGASPEPAGVVSGVCV
jgi:hypothetical protein